jgi:hypothetical protein
LVISLDKSVDILKIIAYASCMGDESLIRKRMICLACNGTEYQADEACDALSSIQGVHHANAVNKNRISLIYSLEHLTFELIESLLKELGFELDNRFFAIIRRNIYQYLEDNAREKMVLEQQEVEHEEHEQQVLMCNIDTDMPHDEPEKYWNNYR